MSVRWIDHIIRERRDLRGAELICAIVIANYASVDDTCYPGFERIAQDCRCTVRQVRETIRRLEEKKVFRIVRGNGRGNRTAFEFIKGDETSPSPLSLEQKRMKAAPFADDKSGSFASIKEEGFRTEKGKVSVSAHKEEPIREPYINPPAETAGEATASLADRLIEGRVGETRRLYVPQSPDTEAWLTTMAPLVGAKSVKTLFNADSWRRTIDDLIHDGYDLVRFLSAVTTSFSEHQGGRERYFGPNAVLKRLQLDSVSSSTGPVTTYGGRVIPAGIDPVSGEPWT